MTTIHDAYVNALLADASYVNNLSNATLEANLRGRMTPELARYIADNFAVVTQANGFLSSFEATVWREINSGNIYVSMRGTQEIVDFAEDADLAISGLAHEQLLSMVNWWLRGTTPTTSYARQIAEQVVLIPGFGVQRNFVPAPQVQGTDELSGISAIKSVNGHSLGGYLASAFARLFGGQWSVELINTFNSAGFSRPATLNIENGFNQIAQAIGPMLGLGGFFGSQNNYFAENGINVTTNTWNPVGFRQFGTRIGLFQEDLTPQFINNHYMYKLTDLLALGDVLEKLDRGMSLAKLSQLVGAASNKMVASYENVLDALRRLLLGADAPSTLVGDANAGNAGPQPLTRQSYHLNVQELLDSAAYKAAASSRLLTISVLGEMQPSEMAVRGQALNGLAYRYALKTLNPFAVLGPDSLYAIHNTGPNARALDLYDKATGFGPLTTNWIEDRSKLLFAELVRNTQDNATLARLPGTDTTATEFHLFRDGKEEIFYAQSASAPSPPRRIGRPRATPTRVISFADDAGRSLGGSNIALGDHLYGGAGKDILSGEAGADRLEGGLGDDNLFGGADADTLMGGAGADLLDGDAGIDTYIWRKGDSLDTITDLREGPGNLKLGNILFLDESLAGTKTQKFADNPRLFEDAAHEILFAYTGTPGVDGILHVVKQGEEGGLKLVDFRSGDFGIVLGELTPVAKTDLNGTADSDNSFSTQSEHGSTLTSDAPNQKVFGLAGNDRIIVAQAGAEAYGGTGDDYITNDTGDQALYGEEGNDILIASGGNDLLDGGTGNDALQGGADDDVLKGGDGDDALDGGAGSDAISGGEGNDFILGGGSIVPVIGEGELDSPTARAVWRALRGRRRGPAEHGGVPVRHGRWREQHRGGRGQRHGPGRRGDGLCRRAARAMTCSPASRARTRSTATPATTACTAT